MYRQTFFLTDDRQNVSNISFISFVGWEAYTSGEIAEYFLVDVGQENNSMASTKTLAIDILSVDSRIKHDLV